MFVYPEKNSVIKRIFNLLAGILNADITKATKATKASKPKEAIKSLDDYADEIIGLDNLRKSTSKVFEAAAKRSESERPTDYQKSLFAMEEKLILLLQVAFHHRQLVLKIPINVDNHKANLDWLRSTALDETIHHYPVVRALHQYVWFSAEILNLRFLSKNVNDQNARIFNVKSLSVLRQLFNLRSEFRLMSYQATDNIAGDFFTEITEGIAHLFKVSNGNGCDSTKFMDKLSDEYREQLHHYSEVLLRSEKLRLVPEDSEASRAELIAIGRIRQLRETIEYFQNIWNIRSNFSATMRREIDGLLASMDKIECLYASYTLLAGANQAMPDDLRLVLKYELEHMYIKANVLHLEARTAPLSPELDRIKSDLRLIIWISIGILGSLEDEKLDGPIYLSLKESPDYRLMIEDISPSFLNEYFSSRPYSPAVYSLIGSLCMLSLKNTLIPVIMDGNLDYILNINSVINMMIIVNNPIMSEKFCDLAAARNFMQDIYCSTLTLCKLDFECRSLSISALETGILTQTDESPNADCVKSSIINSASPIHRFIHNLIKHMNADSGVDIYDYFSGLNDHLITSIFDCKAALESCDALDAVHITVRQFILRCAPLVITYARHADNGRYENEAKAIEDLLETYYQSLYVKSALMISGYFPAQQSVKKPPVDKSSFVSTQHNVDFRKPKSGARTDKSVSQVKPTSQKEFRQETSSKTSSSQPTIESDFKTVFQFFNKDANRVFGFYLKYTSNRHDVTTRAKALLGQAALLPYIAKNQEKIKEIEIMAEKIFVENGELFSFSPKNYKKFKAEYDELLAPFRKPVAVVTPKPAPAPKPSKLPAPPVTSVKSAVTAKSAAKVVAVKSNDKGKRLTKKMIPTKKPTVTSVGMFKSDAPKSIQAKVTVPAKSQPVKRPIKTIATIDKPSSDTSVVSKELYEQVVTNVSMETTQYKVTLTPPTIKSKMKLSLLAAKNINFTPYDPFEGSREPCSADICYTPLQSNLVNVLYEYRRHPVIHGGAPYDKLRYREADSVSRSRDIDLHICGSVDSLMMLCRINAERFDINLALSRIDNNDVAVIVFNSKLPNGEYDSLEISCLSVAECDYKAALLAKSQEFLIERLLVDAHTLTYLNLNGEFDRVYKGNQIQLSNVDALQADESLLRNRHRLADIIKRCAKPNQRGIPMHMSNELASVVIRNWFKLQRTRTGKIKMKQFDSLFLQAFTTQILDVTCQKRQLISIFFPSLEHHMDEETLSELRIFCREFDHSIEANIHEPRDFDSIYNLRVAFLTKLLLPSLKRRHQDISELLKNRSGFYQACKQLLNECMFDFTDKFDVHNAHDARDTLVNRLISTWHVTLTKELAEQPEASMSFGRTK